MEHHIKTKSVRHRWKGKFLAYVWILWMNGSFWCVLPFNEFPLLHIIQTRSPNSKFYFSAIDHLLLYQLIPQNPPSKPNLALAQWHQHARFQRVHLPNLWIKSLVGREKAVRELPIWNFHTQIYDFRNVMTSAPWIILIPSPSDWEFLNRSHCGSSINFNGF